MGVFALIIFIYKISFHSGFQKNLEGNVYFPTLSLAIVIIALGFFISGQFVGGFLPNQLKIIDTEVTPTLGSTLLVTKDALSSRPILGVGPNKFGETWAMYKPARVNNSPFWNSHFESGFGLLPSFASASGYLGILVWLAFFILFVVAGLKSIFASSLGKSNFELALFFLAALYLFTTAFFYPVGSVIFLLAFVFVGTFIGLSTNHEGGQIALSSSDNPRKSFILTSILVVAILVSAGLGFKYIERFASVPYFTKALNADNIPNAEFNINKAVSLNPNDLYLRTYSQIYLIKFNTIANNSSLSEKDKADLQMSFNQAINGAVLATTHNPDNYVNYQALGYVYSTAGVLGVSGAYEKAIVAYSKASTLNPLNPEIKLLIARVYLSQENMEQAKEFATEALTLKPNYIQALTTLSQISKIIGDDQTAISYAETALSLAPDNQDLIKYVESLKRPSAPATVDTNKNIPKQN